MAEIHIEKKKTPLWPWILGLVVVALLIWGISTRTKSTHPDDSATAAGHTSALRTPPGVLSA